MNPSDPGPCPGEFDLIRRYFSFSKTSYTFGVGDDCAYIRQNEGSWLAVSCDTLNEGVHFFPDTSAADVAYKALAVNLSDLAVSGAVPLGFFLALSLPIASDSWLGAFSESLKSVSQQYGCPLLGGDTTRTSGPLSITITILGMTQTPVRRCGAREGDDLWVSGYLGLASAALNLRLKGGCPVPSEAAGKMDHPVPRLLLGQKLAPMIHAACDVSDGLLGDLSHIAKASRLACEVNVDALLWHPSLKAMRTTLSEKELLAGILTGGDDYELLFAAPHESRNDILALSEPDLPLTRIGSFTKGCGLSLTGSFATFFLDGFNGPLGFDHFVRRDENA